MLYQKRRTLFMDVFNAIEMRRSIRKYKKDDVPESVLGKVLNAVRLAPSSCNRQPWKLIIVRDAETRNIIAQACHYVSSSSWKRRIQKWIAEAPVIIVACGLVREANMHYCNREGEDVVIHWDWDTYEKESAKQPGVYESTVPFDLAIVMDHLSLAALAESLGTCWIKAFDENKVKRIMSIPDEIRAPLMMALGYPAEEPGPRPRKSLSELICYEKYI
jgi:nitroreductase